MYVVSVYVFGWIFANVYNFILKRLSCDGLKENIKN